MSRFTVVFLFFLLISGLSYSQEKIIRNNNDTINPPPFTKLRIEQPNDTTKHQTPDSNHVFDFVEKMPEYPGGQVAMMAFIQQNLQYPEYAKDNNLEGSVFATFIIDKKGKITDVKILRSMNPPCIACDSEVIRVIKKMPKWKPGMQQGKPVRVKFTLPVKFALK